MYAKLYFSKLVYRFDHKQRHANPPAALDSHPFYDSAYPNPGIPHSMKMKLEVMT